MRYDRDDAPHPAILALPWLAIMLLMVIGACNGG
tara:strand:- start:239 stop:340 length:102 start_codon:yes stop_codon:yes gene_type:complete